jgi:hypothetical protein
MVPFKIIPLLSREEKEEAKKLNDLNRGHHLVPHTNQDHGGGIHFQPQATSDGVAFYQSELILQVRSSSRAAQFGSGKEINNTAVLKLLRNSVKGSTTSIHINRDILESLILALQEMKPLIEELEADLEQHAIIAFEARLAKQRME